MRWQAAFLLSLLALDTQSFLVIPHSSIVRAPLRKRRMIGYSGFARTISKETVLFSRADKVGDSKTTPWFGQLWEDWKNSSSSELALFTLVAAVAGVTMMFTTTAKNLELAEERAKYRELLIQTQLEKNNLETKSALERDESAVERRILDFLTSSRQGLLTDAIVKALEEVKVK